jgi:2-hydroxy-6-oxonona-2,4-dienedioate hydrolase
MDQSIQRKTIKVNGYAIRYLEYDNVIRKREDGKSLILLHGLAASAERWLLVTATLSKFLRLVIPDIIGFGFSDKPRVEYTMEFFCEFLKALIEELGLDNPSIVGTSFGGLIAAEFAIRFSNRIEKLVLAAPAGLNASTSTSNKLIKSILNPTYENALEAFVDTNYDYITSDAGMVTENTVRSFLELMKQPNAKDALMSTLFRIRDSPKLLGRLVKISVPTLLVWGDNDTMVPLQYASVFNEIPNSKVVVIKGCGHNPFIQKPIEFNKIILRFIIGYHHQ